MQVAQNVPTSLKKLQLNFFPISVFFQFGVTKESEQKNSLSVFHSHLQDANYQKKNNFLRQFTRKTNK